MDLHASAAAAALLSLGALAAAFPDAIRFSAAGAASPVMASKATADLAGPGGEAVGTATFTQGTRGVLLRVEGHGLTPGWHGVHLHAKGDCSDAKFEAAGGHVHAGAASVHGLLNPEATDTGDLPNLYVAADGEASAEMFTALVRLAGPGDSQGLLNGDGAAVIVHAKADDHLSQPIGGAGERIACGVLKPAR